MADNKDQPQEPTKPQPMAGASRGPEVPVDMDQANRGNLDIADIVSRALLAQQTAKVTPVGPSPKHEEANQVPGGEYINDHMQVVDANGKVIEKPTRVTQETLRGVQEQNAARLRMLQAQAQASEEE